MSFTHASLFSGIGGFDLAADDMGWENVLHCEINPFCRKILKYYWPKAISYNDITKTDFSIHRGTIDVLSGGFPCQPYSVAGKQKGTADHRHLWPEMLRAIREIGPVWVVGENVPGLVNWSDGLVFEQVQADLEAEGYEVQAFILPACGIDAPHRRDRIWFVAYSKINSRNIGIRDERQVTPSLQEKRFNEFVSTTNAQGIGQQPTGNTRTRGTGFKDGNKRNDANSDNTGRKKRNIAEKPNKQGQRTGITIEGWDNWPTQSPVCSRNDGLSPRLDGITFSKWRNESIKGAGNAVVPGLVLQIFKAIEEMTNNLDNICK